MKAYKNGELVIEGRLSGLATGYACDKIELDAQDARDLRALALDNYDKRVPWFAQFEARFEDNRVPRFVGKLPALAAPYTTSADCCGGGTIDGHAPWCKGPPPAAEAYKRAALVIGYADKPVRPMTDDEYDAALRAHAKAQAEYYNAMAGSHVIGADLLIDGMKFIFGFVRHNWLACIGVVVWLAIFVGVWVALP